MTGLVVLRLTAPLEQRDEKTVGCLLTSMLFSRDQNWLAAVSRVEVCRRQKREQCRPVFARDHVAGAVAPRSVTARNAQRQNLCAGPQDCIRARLAYCTDICWHLKCMAARHFN